MTTRQWAMALGSAIGLGYFWLSPPLFNYDGYVYRLQGLAPLDTINPTHLLWIPFQWVLWQMSYLLHASSPRFFQAASVLILALVYARSFSLWSLLSENRVVAGMLTLFAASSPSVWYLGSQNQPYPLLFLCVISCLWAVLGPRPKRAQAAFWLILATLLHEAAILLCLGFAVVLLCADGEPLATRLRKSAAWLIAVGLFVGSGYVLTAYFKGIHSSPAFLNWLAGYLHTQHHLQGRWYENLSKSLVGITYTVLSLQRHEDMLYAHYKEGEIRMGLVIACALLVLSLIVLLWRLEPCKRASGISWRDHKVEALSAAFITFWAFFVIAWEPTNYYWAVALFPGLTLAARALRKDSVVRPPVLGLIGTVIIWNLYGDLQGDKVNARRFPDGQLRSIHQRVNKNDVLLFLKQGWHDGVDYDLLGRCLTLEGYHVEYLLDHYVTPEPAAWSLRLANRLRRARRDHQNVFVSQWLLRPDLYADLANAYFLSSYVIEKYQPISGPSLFIDVQAFFRAHSTRPFDLKLENDAFVRVIPGSGK